jgi:AcrR family transcriptional regulator
VTVAQPVRARVDARRNRERLLAAARDLLAADGVDVPVREIAQRAGVGVATLYRHFPTRGHLVDAVLEDAFEEYVASAEAALADTDAWRAFTGFVEQVVAVHARNRGLKDVVETRAHGRDRAAAMRRRLAPLVAQLVERAQADGSLRADFTPQDVALVVWGADRVAELAGDVAPAVWRRHLGLVFDGLRPDGAAPLPHPPLTEKQERRIGTEIARKAAR